MLYSSALTVIIWRCNPASIYRDDQFSMDYVVLCVSTDVLQPHTRHVLDGSRSRSPDSTAKKERKKKPKGWINLWYDILYPYVLYTLSLSSSLVGGCHNKY